MVLERISGVRIPGIDAKLRKGQENCLAIGTQNIADVHQRGLSEQICAWICHQPLICSVG